MQVLVYSFKPGFELVMHVFFTILTSYQPSNPQDLWNDYRGMFIADICSRSRRLRDLPRIDFYAFPYAFSEVKNILSKMPTAQFSTVGLLNRLEDHSPPTTKQERPEIQLEFLCSENSA